MKCRGVTSLLEALSAIWAGTAYGRVTSIVSAILYACACIRQNARAIFDAVVELEAS